MAANEEDETRVPHKLRQRSVRKVDKSFKFSFSKTESRLSAQANFVERVCWYPKASVVFNVLLSARITAAFLSNISDCDETYNYWEPMHFLMYGKGFQTWEYSPEYAIRSYAYILLHVVPAQLVQRLFEANRLMVFYYVRFLLGVLCATTETYFYNGVIAQFGEHVGRMMFIILVFSSGMYISATAFLPSSFAMYACMLAFGGWFKQNFAVAIFGIALGSLVGWPFCAALGIPIAFDIVVRRRKLLFFIEWALGSFAAIMIPLVAVDAHYYGKQVIAPLNIVLYNIFGQGGPDLYGVEPWTYYFVNGFLNFNFVFCLSLIALPLYLIVDYFSGSLTKGSGFHIPTWIALGPLYIWYLIFFTRPHKEERFLFPVYPLICLAGAIVLSNTQEIYHRIFTKGNRKHYSSSSNWFSCLFLVIFTLLSLSRSRALYAGYHAPLDVYADMHNDVLQNDPEKPSSFQLDDSVNVCVGKEWYRFPSNFFLPSNTWSLNFIKSDFRGQLPQPYGNGADATKRIPPYMNANNAEEPMRYMNISQCDILVDLQVHSDSHFEPNYALQTKRWEVLYSKPFLDSSRSKSLYRAFYIPFFSEKHTTFAKYNILKSKRKRRKKRIIRNED